MRRYILLSVVVLAGLLLLSYQVKQQHPQLPAHPLNYTHLPLPPHLAANVVQSMDNTPANNPLTDAGATLGRVLFYDKKLSINDSIACGSCHLAQHAFSDPARQSVGFAGGHTARHAMSVANVRFYQNGRFFWDERAESLEAQSLQPIQDPVEMGMKLKKLEKKLRRINYYPPLFEAAFGSPAITAEGISKALAQFMRSMVSYRSRYDEGRIMHEARAPFSNFSQLENDGKVLFFDIRRTACSNCHLTDLFVGVEPRNNGLFKKSEDRGVGELTDEFMDEGVFKAPSLRNIALTAPYMHDGSLATLEEVIDHYDQGVKDHDNLHLLLRAEGPMGPGSGPPRRLNLSPYEKTALRAFLETLTDSSLISDERWADPF